MLVSLDSCDVLDLVFHGSSSSGLDLPLLAKSLIGNAALVNGYDPLEALDGAMLFLSLQNYQARQHATLLHPSALEATTGYLSVGKAFNREGELIRNFSHANRGFSKMIYEYFTVSTLFGAVIAYDALRKIDLSKRDLGLVSKVI